MTASIGIAGALRAPSHSLAEGFTPGRIIEDAEFFDGGALDARGVQAFLDERQDGGCRDGADCLADFRNPLPARPRTERCDEIAGNPDASAAEIIATVGRACRVSEKVLLVMLEKEQSLVSNVAPDLERYDRAMGYSCPDDLERPGWCDPEFGGFANQVYAAAEQFQRYRLEPHEFRVVAGRENDIAYHPNAPECGVLRVAVENQATAGLYNYTPYVPNAAASDPSLPEGDACSSFGNLNFWRFYGEWFREPAPSR